MALTSAIVSLAGVLSPPATQIPRPRSRSFAGASFLCRHPILPGDAPANGHLSGQPSDRRGVRPEVETHTSHPSPARGEPAT